jgi:hypothetical protein
VNWACADNAQGNILGNNCTKYNPAPLGSPDTKRCEGVVHMVVQQKTGAKGLTIYVKDGMIKSNFNITGKTQCGWPGGCAGEFPSGVSARMRPYACIVMATALLSYGGSRISMLMSSCRHMLTC